MTSIRWMTMYERALVVARMYKALSQTGRPICSYM